MTPISERGLAIPVLTSTGDGAQDTNFSKNLSVGSIVWALSSLVVEVAFVYCASPGCLRVYAGVGGCRLGTEICSHYLILCNYAVKAVCHFRTSAAYLESMGYIINYIINYVLKVEYVSYQDASLFLLFHTAVNYCKPKIILCAVGEMYHRHLTCKLTLIQDHKTNAHDTLLSWRPS
jgi:hypothetical protein